MKRVEAENKLLEKRAVVLSVAVTNVVKEFAKQEMAKTVRMT